MGCTLTCCSPRVTQPAVIQRTETDTRYIRDTVYEQVFVTVREKADTVYVTKEQYRYKEHWAHDTVMVAQVDSIPYEKEVPVYVERRLKGYEKGLMFIGLMSIAILLFLLIRKLKRVRYL